METWCNGSNKEYLNDNNSYVFVATNQAGAMQKESFQKKTCIVFS